jgi:hypothetical protein
VQFAGKNLEEWTKKNGNRCLGGGGGGSITREMKILSQPFPQAVEVRASEGHCKLWTVQPIMCPF